MWLNYGDANTKYFHLKTIQRRSHSQVITLKDGMGLWFTGEPLTHHIHTAFKTLFRATSPCWRITLGTERLCCPHSPFLTQAQVLTRIPQPDEIFQTFRELPPLKVPRLDGYHALFFQTNWSSLDPASFKLFKTFFSISLSLQTGGTQTWSLFRKLPTPNWSLNYVLSLSVIPSTNYRLVLLCINSNPTWQKPSTLVKRDLCRAAAQAII